MTVIAYNALRGGKIVYLDGIRQRQPSQKLSLLTRKNIAWRVPSLLIFSLASLLAFLYFRETLFYSTATSRINLLQSESRELVAENQILKENISRLESFDNLKQSAAVIGLTTPKKILYPKDTFYSFR